MHFWWWHMKRTCHTTAAQTANKSELNRWMWSKWRQQCKCCTISTEYFRFECRIYIQNVCNSKSLPYIFASASMNPENMNRTRTCIHAQSYSHIEIATDLSGSKREMLQHLNNRESVCVCGLFGKFHLFGRLDHFEFGQNRLELYLFIHLITIGRCLCNVLCHKHA